MRMDAKRKALQALSERHPEPEGCDKRTSQIPSRDDHRLGKLLKELVDLVGFEPTTSSMPLGRMILGRMRRDRTKWQAHNRVAGFRTVASCIAEHRVSSTCSG